MADVTVTTAATAIPEIWPGLLLPAANANMVAAAVATKIVRPGKFGDTLHIPLFGNFNATAKAAGSDVTFLVNTDGEKTIVLDGHFYSAHVIEDIVQKLAMPEYLLQFADKAAIAVAQRVDTVILALNSSLTEAVGTTTTKVALTWANILAMIEDLDGNDVPPGDRAFIFNPVGKQKLGSLTQFISQDYRAVGGVLRQVRGSDPFGFILDTPCYVSSKVAANKAFLVHKEAWGYALASEPELWIERRDIRKLADLIAVSVIYGEKALRPGFGTALNYAS